MRGDHLIDEKQVKHVES